MAVYDTYLKALSADSGSDISLEADGTATFIYDGRGLMMQWLDDQQAFFIYVEVGFLMGWGDITILQRVLAANFMFANTSGGAFSYNPETNTLGLNYLIPAYNLDNEGFVKQMRKIIACADMWSTTLREMYAEQESIAQKRIDAVESGEDLPTGDEINARSVASDMPMMDSSMIGIPSNIKFVTP